ncbi:MAG: hypothetical protein ACRENB_07265 [Gemmatimonadales bacterium]
MGPGSLITSRTRPTLRALAGVFVPESRALDEAGWRSFERIVESGLASRPRALVRRIRVFLSLLDLAARVRHGRRLSGLPHSDASRLVGRFAASPLLGFRKGVWGLRTLVFLGYYGDQARSASLGYRGTAAGWSRA